MGLMEVVVRIRDPPCKLAREAGGYVVIEDVRRGGDRVSHLVRLPADRLEEVRSVAGRVGVEMVEHVVVGDSVLAWFSSEGCEACKPVAFSGAFLVGGRMLEDGSLEFSFVAPEDGYDRILESLRGSGLDFEVERVSRLRTESVLTTNQEKVLYAALKLGLFDHPRRTTVEELSRMLGVRPSTLAESIRRGLKRLLEFYFSSQERG